MKLNKLTSTSQKASLTVSDQVFGLKENRFLLAQAIRVYLNNLHLGTSTAKTRSEVKRTTKKWYRQKGTGNARHGARSAPIFVGGGVAHGPRKTQPKILSLSKIMRRKALALALSLKVKQILVLDQLDSIDNKTQTARNFLIKAGLDKQGILIILPALKNTLALRNLANVSLKSVNRVNALDILRARQIALNSQSVKALEERVLKK